MLIKRAERFRSSEITPRAVYEQRRRLLKGVFASLVTGVGILRGQRGWTQEADGGKKSDSTNRFANLAKSPYSLSEAPTAYEHVTRYNNFYEFSTAKESPAILARTFHTDPWSVVVEGEVDAPGVYSLEDILAPHALEERIYRLRCVEAWSMVVPWVGFPLADLLKRFLPTSRAKYVAFETLYDPDRMPGQRRRDILEWPYREALRIDEAMHPLTILAVGLYGQALPNQNGAPLRLVVPWKYGFKSIKSIVKIQLTEQRPDTSWNLAVPREYGFYANVNPDVAHPRWSQKRERIVGASLFTPKRQTEAFNGYATEVAGLYQGMDLRKDF